MCNINLPELPTPPTAATTSSSCSETQGCDYSMWSIFLTLRLTCSTSKSRWLVWKCLGYGYCYLYCSTPWPQTHQFQRSSLSPVHSCLLLSNSVWLLLSLLLTSFHTSLVITHLVSLLKHSQTHPPEHHLIRVPCHHPKELCAHQQLFHSVGSSLFLLSFPLLVFPSV